MTPNNIVFVAATALTVSADSFAAGFSLALNRQKSLILPCTVAAVTYFLCLAACVAGEVLKPLLSRFVNYIGAAILFGLGVAGLLGRETETLRETEFSQCLAIGFGVGLDGAAASLSLVLEGTGDAVFLPILMAVTHFVTVFAGQRLAQIAKPRHAGVFSAVLFFVLAAAKLLD